MGKTLFMVFLLSLTASLWAGMPYHLEFKSASNASKLVNTGSVGGTVKAKTAGNVSVEFSMEKSPSGVGICKFKKNTLQKRGPILILPDSEDKFRCDKLGATMTIAFWVKRDGTQSFAGIIGNSDAKQQRGWMLRFEKDGRISFCAFGGFGMRNTLQKVKKGEWTHVAMSWEVGKLNGLKFYFNGHETKINKAIFSNSPVEKSPNPIRIGSLVPSQYMSLNGSISDVRIFDEIIDPAGIGRLADKK